MLFRSVVSRKDPEVYRRILDRYGIAPERFLMVGDSLRSDVLPVLEVGAAAVHIPNGEPWQHEAVAVDAAIRGRYTELSSIRELTQALSALAATKRT